MKQYLASYIVVLFSVWISGNMEQVLRDLDKEILAFQNICQQLQQGSVAGPAQPGKPEIKPKPILVMKKEKPKILPKPKLALKSSVRFLAQEDTEGGTEV